MADRLRHFVLFAGVFLVVWGAKLTAISAYGSDLPYWDQWGKEGELLFQPWFERHEFWRWLLVPHNEHRIAPTMVLNFGLLKAGGDQWDARVQCVASTALHALLVAGLVYWVSRRFGRKWGIAVAVVATVISAPPIVTENVLGGFQSQFYFIAIFSILSAAALLGSRAFTARWFAGLICAALACVSMGSGFLVSAPLGAIAVWRLLRREHSRDAWATLAASVLIGAVGVWFRPQAPWHAPMHAHNLIEFATYAARCLAWPLYNAPWLAPVVWSPWLVLTWKRLRRSDSEPGSVATDFVLAGGAWVLVQIAAVSYSRGGGSVMPAVRYGDVSSLGLVFNALALPLIFESTRSRRSVLVPAFWCAVVVVMMALGTNSAYHGNLVSKRRENREYEKNVRAFILTDDFDAFSKQELPFPSPEWLSKVLRRPSLRRLMPASVRDPVRIEGFANAVPPAPPLLNRPTHTVTAPGEWRSAVLRPGTGWWKIETSGDVTTAGAKVSLISARTGKVLSTIRPTKAPGNAWRAAYVPAPTEPAFLTVQVASPAQWVAVSEPIAMSTLSYRTWRLTEHGWWVVGLGMLVLAVGASGRRSTARVEQIGSPTTVS